MKNIDFYEQAEKHRILTQYDSAVELYRKALKAFKREKSIQGVLDCHISLGDTFRAKGDFLKAMAFYEEGGEIAAALEDRTAEADIFAGIGLCLRAFGNCKDAFIYINRAQRLYRLINDNNGIAFSLWAKAGTFRIRGDIHRALRSFHLAYEGFKALKNRSGVAYAYCGLGGTSRVNGSYGDSEKYYGKANRLFADLRDRFGLAYSYCGLGNACRMRHDYKNALLLFKKAEVLYNKIGDRVSYAYTLWSMGTTYKMMGKFQKAIKCFHDADDLFRKTRDPRGRIYCMLGMGEVQYLLGNERQAKTRILKGVKQAEQYDFRVERNYSKTLLEYLKTGAGLPFNMP